MKDDYLWDGSGEPDPEIQRLETALGKFRHRRPAPDFASIAEVSSGMRKRRALLGRVSWALVAAAAVVLVIGLAAVVLRRPRQAPPSQSGWNVKWLAGTPQVGTKAFGQDRSAGRLLTGETLVTDSRSRASIALGEVGEVEVGPDTRLRLLKASSAQNRLALERGTIQAAVWAPPGEFVVDTPSAVAVDLGCAYSLHVDDSGAGLLRTTFGWVGFKLGDRESFIPAGAVCITRPGVGPSTPYFEDAPPLLRASLVKLDFGAGSPEQRHAELGVVLSQARKQDALTLWHLLARVSPSERGRVYDRLAALVPPPAGVSREGIRQLDQKMLDRWWNQLGFGDIALWHTWERSWSPSDEGR